MNEIDLVVVVDKSNPVSIAYLEYMKAHGYRPRRLILVDFIKHTKKLSILSSLLGKNLALFILSEYRKRRVKNYHILRDLCLAIQNSFPLQINFDKQPIYSDYCQDLVVVPGFVESFQSPFLLETLRTQELKTFLYTGGGIVPSIALKIPNAKFIHIHPGLVPRIKGSDGFFWSLLIHGQPGMSCIYLNSGIDTGCVIATQEYEAPHFGRYDNISIELKYQAILKAYDPHLRAQTLIGVLDRHCQSPERALSELPSLIQDSEAGVTYFKMHELMKKNILERIFS